MVATFNKALIGAGHMMRVNTIRLLCRVGCLMWFEGTKAGCPRARTHQALDVLCRMWNPGKNGRDEPEVQNTNTMPCSCKVFARRGVELKLSRSDEAATWPGNL